MNKLLEKYRYIKKLIKFLGLTEVLKIYAGRIFKGREGTHEIGNSALRHPFTITFAGGDIAMYSEVIPRKVYDLPGSLDEYVTGKLIVDIGANIGTAAVYFANRYPKSQVLSIEPHPRNFELLKKNISPYGKQLEARQAAFALDNEPIALTNTEVAKEGRHASYMFSNSLGNASKDAIKVPSIRPADILKISKSRIGILKVDIEGGEKDIFASKQIDALLEATNILMIETHDRYFSGSAKVVHDAAARNGFIEIKERGNEHFFINRSAT